MKIKSLLLIPILLLIMSNGAWAQEKYDFAIIYLEKASMNSEFGINGMKLCVFSNSESNCEKIDKETAEQKLVLKVEEFNTKGWEVYQSNTSSIGRTYQFTYYLRKKKD